MFLWVYVKRKSQENCNKTGKHRDKCNIWLYTYRILECRVFSRETNIHNVQGDYVNLLPRMLLVVGFIEVDKCYKVITKTVSAFLSCVYFFT